MRIQMRRRRASLHLMRGGRGMPVQRPLPFCVCETGALGEAPSPGGVRTDVVATSKDIVGLKLILRPRTLRAAELAKCRLGPHYSTAAVPQLVPQ